MDFFQDINSLDIVQIIGKHISIDKKNKACCPFHEEKTPSFSVNPKTNRWRCFGCGEGGSAIDFIMKRKNMTAWEAACYIARENGIEIPKQTPEDQEKYDHLEALRTAMKKALQWFAARLPENDVATRYLAARWDEKIIKDWELGYAPEGFDFIHWAEKENLLVPLKETGLIATGKSGKPYSFFQNRIVFPVHDQNGRMVAFTGRKLNDTDPSEAKYRNTPESVLYTKGNILFGLNRAIRNIKEKKRLYLVEGNPDVITLHAINKVGTVCPMGTALTTNQIELIKKLECMVVIIGDADAAGQKAVDKNARLLIGAGIGVSIVSLMGEDGKKEDPDSFFNKKSKAVFDDYVRNNIRDYILAMTTIEADLAGNNADHKSRLIDDISKMVACYPDAQKRAVYIEELSKIIKPKLLWKKSLNMYVSDRSDDRDFIKSRIPSNVSVADAERYGFYSMDNAYYFRSKDGFNKGSNFILQPLFHIQSVLDAKRLFQITNENGFGETIEISQKDMVSLQGFKVRIESLGNFLWEGSEIDMNRLKRYLYEKTQSCTEIKQLGWQKQGFWAWSNGIYNGKFTHVDEYGIAVHEEKNYYIPAHSKIYEKEDTLYVSERKFCHTEGKSSFSDYTSKLIDVFGDNAKIAVAFYIASLFRDYIFRVYGFFPILNLFGPKGAGKTEMAMAMMQFFGNMPKGPNMSNSTLPALSDHIAMASNACIHIDEYKNSVDFTKVEFLKGLWDGTGRSRMNMDKDKKKEVTAVDSGIVLSGQEMPTADIALFSRLIFLSFTKTEYSDSEKEAFMEMKNTAKKGLSQITNELLGHRQYFIKHYLEMHDEVMREMGEEVNAVIEDRIMRNWCVVLAALRTVEEKVKLPFTFAGTKKLAAHLIRRQNSEVKKGNEVSIFWDIFQYLVAAGDIQEKTDFKFDFTVNIQTDMVSKVLKDAITVIYVRKDRVFQLYRKHGNSTKENILPIKTLEYYLTNSPAYMGIKKVKFNRNSDETATVAGSNDTKKICTTAMAFDYDKLGINVVLEFDSEEGGATFTRPLAPTPEEPATPTSKQMKMEDLNVRKVDI